MGNFKNLLKIFQNGQSLSFSQAKDFQTCILTNSFLEVDLIAAFRALEGRALTFDELKGFYEASKEVMVQVETGLETLDTCGTGGDKSGSFNISTAAAIIASAAGVPVAKHGNRAASSLCGSADVLEALGLNIDLTKPQAEECLRSCGFVFLLAKNFHPAFRFAASARKTYGKKTYFNLLGPLLNPGQAKYRVHGLFDFSQAENLGKLLIDSGVKRAWLVHSEDGLDEISPSAPSKVLEFSQASQMQSLVIDPADFGFSNCSLAEIKGGNAQVNAQIILDIFNNQANLSQTAAAVLNSAAGLIVYGKAENFGQAVEIAQGTLKSGKALNKLLQMRAICKAAYQND